MQNIYIHNSNKNYRRVKLCIYNSNSNNNNFLLNRLYEKLCKAMLSIRISLKSLKLKLNLKHQLNSLDLFLRFFYTAYPVADYYCCC